jgi:hypothetical protein
MHPCHIFSSLSDTGSLLSPRPGLGSFAPLGKRAGQAQGNALDTLSPIPLGLAGIFGGGPGATPTFGPPDNTGVHEIMDWGLP